MTPTKNLESVKELFAAYASGDRKKIVASFAENAEIVSPGRSPWSGTHRGVAGLERFLGSMDDSITYEAFEPLEHLAQGDKVVTLGREAWKAKKSGKRFEGQWAVVTTLRDGKVTRMRLLEDTAAVAAAIAQ